MHERPGFDRLGHFGSGLLHRLLLADLSRIGGGAAFFYGLFVAMPLSVALLVGLTMGRHGYRVLCDGQLPPIGEKVFSPTRIERGRKAKLTGYAQMYSFLLPLAIAVWGLPQASGLIASFRAELLRLSEFLSSNQGESKYPLCRGNG